MFIIDGKAILWNDLVLETFPEHCDLNLIDQICVDYDLQKAKDGKYYIPYGSINVLDGFDFEVLPYKITSLVFKSKKVKTTFKCGLFYKGVKIDNGVEIKRSYKYDDDFEYLPDIARLLPSKINVVDDVHPAILIGEICELEDTYKDISFKECVDYLKSI